MYGAKIDHMTSDVQKGTRLVLTGYFEYKCCRDRQLRYFVCIIVILCVVAYYGVKYGMINLKSEEELRRGEHFGGLGCRV